MTLIKHVALISKDNQGNIAYSVAVTIAQSSVDISIPHLFDKQTKLHSHMMQHCNHLPIGLSLDVVPNPLPNPT